MVKVYDHDLCNKNVLSAYHAWLNLFSKGPCKLTQPPALEEFTNFLYPHHQNIFGGYLLIDA